MKTQTLCCTAAVIGAGPAGLAAAEMLSAAGHRPVVFEAKPTAARKFLMAGKSGLNLTKDQRADAFADRIECPQLTRILGDFGPADIQSWAKELGEPLFTGSSGRVFPVAMKGSPLLRKWMDRLAGQGTTLRTRWIWQGWDGDLLRFETPDGCALVDPGITVLALGGASWPRLGSDAAWVPWLSDAGVEVTPFVPSNVGFNVPWSDHIRDRFAGAPVKAVGVEIGGSRARGDFVVTGYGIEGGTVYEVSAAVRSALRNHSPVELSVDLLPDLSAEDVAARLGRPRGKASMANHLRRALGLTGIKAALLHEAQRPLPALPGDLATLIKEVPIKITGPRPITEAISSAGGISWQALDVDLMLRARPGTFAAGEMLDWDAPTGGYLLTASIALGRHAGRAAARRLGGG